MKDSKDTAKEYNNALNEYKSLLSDPHLSLPLEYLFSYDYDLDYDVEDSVSVIKKNSAVARVYRCTNEKNNDIYKKIKIDGGRALVVGSSGDQAIYALLNGAKDVTIMDLNMYTKPFTELKIALIKKLDYPEFYYYICDFSTEFFRMPKIYAKVAQYLSPETQNFWDTVLLEGDEFLLKKIFHGSSGFDISNSIYGSREVFEKAKKVLSRNDYKLKVVIEQMENFADSAEGKYDLVELSNIYDYCYLNDDKKAFKKMLEKLYKNHLNVNGSIQVRCVPAHSINVLKSYYREYKNILKNSFPHHEYFLLKNTGLFNFYGKKGNEVFGTSIFIKKLKEEKVLGNQPTNE